MTGLEEPPAFLVETIVCLLQGVRVVSIQLLLLSLGQASNAKSAGGSLGLVCEEVLSTSCFVCDALLRQPIAIQREATILHTNATLLLYPKLPVL